jgi:tetratricopeptide (TPR) repeat protein
MLDLSINRIGTVPILIILTGRPEFNFRWGGAPHTREICLERLTKAEGQSIIDAIARPAVVPDQILDQILDKADGIPLFVEELTKTMLETGVSDNPQLHDEHWEPIVEMSVPETLKDSLTARLDRLPEAREVAQFGSVIGREFSLELISSIVPKSKATLDFALHRLLHSGIISKRGSDEDAVFTFTHALIQEAAYESLLRSRRAYLHNQIATVLEGDFRDLVESEPEILAHHYTEAGAVSRAIPSWVSAGERAVRRGALQEALGHYQQGLALVEDLPPQSDRVAMELKIREHLTTTCIALFGWAAPQVGANAAAIVQLAENHESSRSLPIGQYGMWLNCLAQGRIAESLDLTRESHTSALASEDCKLTQLAQNQMTMASNFYLGRLKRAQEIGEKHLALCEAQLATGAEAQLIGHDMKTGVGRFAAHWTWMMGYPDQAVIIAEETNAHARKIGQHFNLAFALTFCSQVYFYRCEPDRLLERCEEADELGREQSMLFVRQILVPAIEGLVRLRQGRFAEAIDLLTLSIDRRIKRGQKFLLPHYRSALAEAHARNGNLEGGLQLIEECLEQIERPGWEERVWLPEVRRLKGWMLLQRGRMEPAEEEFVASIDCARRQQAKSWELRSSISLARLWNTLGKRQQAHEMLAPLYGWFTEGFDSKDLKDAKRLLGQDEQDIAVNA